MLYKGFGYTLIASVSSHENKLSNIKHTLLTVNWKERVSFGSVGGSGSPPRRSRLAEPLVVCCIGSLPSGVARSLSFQLNITRAVLGCARYVMCIS